MTLWQQPAHLLPVRVRPIGGETVVSYVFRLAAANALARPTTLLRALGDPLGVRPTATMVHNSEVTLNAPALARLETFTGLPAAWLCHALPGLSASRGDRLPHTDPTLRAFRSAAIRDHCHCCIARIPGRPQVRVRGHEAPSICRRHRRWVGTTGDHPDQIDLSGNAEILTADRRPPTRPAVLDCRRPRLGS
ncbi:TniQ family protein (plasmid) [Rhodococcus sp. DMF-1]|uniref:TniQ family protein n=1 Tax=Rhodococcus sp. DMF-1 TaxID=2907624 RepID=UPI001F232309|nr:TniQ family protein [Rhodococcus sp. DMF-1]UIR39682.1 TniQ family protein [Rhodococcus sp. DMF-1]